MGLFACHDGMGWEVEVCTTTTTWGSWVPRQPWAWTPLPATPEGASALRNCPLLLRSRRMGGGLRGLKDQSTAAANPQGEGWGRQGDSSMSGAREATWAVDLAPRGDDVTGGVSLPTSAPDKLANTGTSSQMATSLSGVATGLVTHWVSLGTSAAGGLAATTASVGCQRWS